MRGQSFIALGLLIGLFGGPLTAWSQGDPATTFQRGVAEPVQEEGAYSQGMPSSTQPLAPTLNLPAGTLITVRLTQMLSSEQNRLGDGFISVLDQPLVAQGWVVSRRGQTVAGQVVVAQNAGRVQGVSQLAIELTELVLVDGQQVPVRTEFVESSGETSQGRDARGVATTTGIGAAVGAAAGGGKGAAIGAAAGVAAGIAGVLTTRGRPAELYPETLLTFRLENPIMISTGQGRAAFRPVTQEDYDRPGPVSNRARSFRAPSPYPPRPPRFYSNDYYPRFYYPGYGYYGYFRVPPRIYVVPRAHFGRGLHRHR